MKAIPSAGESVAGVQPSGCQDKLSSIAADGRLVPGHAGRIDDCLQGCRAIAALAFTGCPVCYNYSSFNVVCFGYERRQTIFPLGILVTYINTASFWGIGTTLYGWRPALAGRHVVTRWITFLFFPIVPVRSYVIDFTKDGRRASDYVLSMFGFVRDSLAGEATAALCWQQVTNTYLYAYLPWAVALCFGRVVPDFVAWIMASVILASWFYAAIMMRRVFRRRSSTTP